jgi:hypothetical protein
MKDVSVDIDRRTPHNGNIDSSVKPFNPDSHLAFNLIECGQPFMGPFSTTPKFDTEHTEKFNSKDDIEVRELLKRLSLEEKVSDTATLILFDISRLAQHLNIHLNVLPIRRFCFAL